jgi:peroxiredoxin
MIREGQTLPEATFVVMEKLGPELKSTRDIFAGRRVALFGLPGAYTPVCNKEHLPGIVALHDTLRQHGIDTVACTAVNDVFVLSRWARDHGAKGKVMMLADGNADFATKSGLAVDLTQFGLGIRSNRYAMLVADGTVTMLNVESVLSKHDQSSAATLCARMSETAPQGGAEGEVYRGAENAA